MIEKPSIIITSLGRTGTLFFAKFFRNLLPDSTSLHEPDMLTLYKEQGYGIRQAIENIAEYGIQNLIIKKAIGRWTLVLISDDRVRNKLSDGEAAKKLLNQRRRFINARPGKVYVESTAGYYGLIDIVPNVFKNYRLVYIIRDGRDWVRSWMNWGNKGGMYNKKPLRRLFGHKWPIAPDIDDDPYASKWPVMSRFEKLCWAWNHLNSYALKTVEKNPDALLLRFEDLFKAEKRYVTLQEMVAFALHFPEGETAATRNLDGLLEKQVNMSEGALGRWDDWTSKEKDTFASLCGPLMARMDYRL